MNKRKILFSIFIGICFALFLFFNYREKEINPYKVYMLQIGAFKNYNNAISYVKNYDNYIIKEEDGMYKVVLGLSSNKDNINKIKEFYNFDDNNMYIKEENMSDKTFKEYLEKFDIIMSNVKNNKSINLLNKALINKYKELKL